ncbi:MAG: hypothetical protein AVDCRST_MAG30-2986, partial [uncultured Solirubrobacteraceae bacterium]
RATRRPAARGPSPACGPPSPSTGRGSRTPCSPARSCIAHSDRRGRPGWRPACGAASRGAARRRSRSRARWPCRTRWPACA